MSALRAESVTSTERSTQRHITYSLGLVRAVVSCVGLGPAAGESAPRRNRNPVPKPWKVRVAGLLHVHATEALGLMLPSFLAGQHGIRDVAVAVEDGVVVAQSHRGRVAR